MRVRAGGLAILAAGVALGVAFSHAPAGAAVAASAGHAASVAASRKLDPVAMWVRYPAAHVTLDAKAALGRLIFADASLSVSGKQSCASCHDPAHAYGPPDGRAVQPGGATLDRFGTRAVPSLRYLRFTPLFSRHLPQPSSDGVEDEGPAGGYTRDGAAQSLHDQALLPLMNPAEMGNTSVAGLAARLRSVGYVAQFRQVFGADVLDHPAAAATAAAIALEAFEQQDPSFQPYTSKFDAAMSGNTAFTPQELHGYTLFNDPQKGNCAKCHVDVPGPGGRPAQFTDFGLVAVGVPRSVEIRANRDPRFFDLGACGPIRHDLGKEPEFCGMFKTPTLRNASSRGVFFHNGRFHTMDEVLHFYAERDTDPAKWYPRAHGQVVAFDDMPARYRANVDHVDVPFTLKPGDKPLLDAAEIADLSAFLKTLDDGWSRESGGPASN